MNQKLLGIAGIVVILGIAFALSTNRKAIRLRVVGAAFALQAVDRLAGAVHQLGTGRRSRALSAGVADLLGYADQGHRIPVRPERDQPARAHLRHRRAAGDHLLRQPRRDPLLSRDHAADRPLGRRRDRLGDRASAGSNRCRAAANIFVGQSESPLVVRPYLAALAALAPVHGDVRRHGRRRRHDPCRLREPARAQAICPTCSPPPSCRRRAAS